MNNKKYLLKNGNIKNSILEATKELKLKKIGSDQSKQH